MADDMSEDLFADQPYGQVALKKINSTDPNFRLYSAGWMGNGKTRDVMEITGAVFRRAEKGPNKGLLNIKVPDTNVKVYVTSEEMTKFEADNPDFMDAYNKKNDELFKRKVKP